jgi:hypothetical protein
MSDLFPDGEEGDKTRTELSEKEATELWRERESERVRESERERAMNTERVNETVRYTLVLLKIVRIYISFVNLLYITLAFRHLL